MIDNSLCLLDSNVLVYAYDSSEGKKHKTAKKLLQSCFDGEHQFVLSVQNLAEFFSIVTKKIPVPLDVAVAQQICDDIINFSGFISCENSHWREAMMSCFSNF